MKCILTLALLTILYSCDQPMQTRIADTQPIGANKSSLCVSNQYVKTNTGEFVCIDSITDPTAPENPAPTNPVDGGGTEDPITSESGFENCNLNPQFYNTNIGYFGICQSSKDESSFKLKMQQTDNNIGTCFVPIHIESAGNSFGLGIAECVNNEADKVYSMILRKNRAELINGVMVLKANALNSYNQCLVARASFINSNPGCQNSSTCMNAAQQYMNDICTSFVTNYGTFYKQVNF